MTNQPTQEKMPSQPHFDLPEAGGVAWTEMYTPSGQKVNVTARGKTLCDAVDELDRGIKYSNAEHGWMGIAKFTQSKRANAQQVKTPSGTPLHATTSDAKPENLPNQTGEFLIVKYEVAKDPDGTAHLFMYQQGHQYPDLRVSKWQVDKIAQLLKSVQATSGLPWEQAITNAETGNVQWKVAWKNTGQDKLNRAGKPYKNVQSVAPFA